MSVTSAGDFLANYVQSTANQLVSKGDWYQVASSGQMVNDASTYAAATGAKASETIQTETPDGTVQDTAQVSFGAGGGQNASVTITDAAGNVQNFTFSCTPIVQVAADPSLCARGQWFQSRCRG